MKASPLKSISLASLLFCAESQSTEFFEHFNDNSRDPSAWNAPVTTKGDARLNEANKQLELTVLSANEGSEAVQALSNFHPRANQAWNAEFLTFVDHRVLSGDGARVSMGIRILDARDPGRFLEFTSGATSSSGEWISFTFPNLRALDSDGISAPERTDLLHPAPFSETPKIIGMRVEYQPTDALLHLYTDADIFHNDGEWTLLGSFSLNGSDPVPGETKVRNWSMEPSDVFNLEVVGSARSANINPRNVYIDDLRLTSQPISFDVWADQISDPEMRGATDDASGNGIQNLLQYFLGLSPTDTRTGAGLRCAREDGRAYLVHGSNVDLTGIFAIYERRNDLGEKGVWTAILPGPAQAFTENGLNLVKMEVPMATSQNFFQVRLILPQ